MISLIDRPSLKFFLASHAQPQVSQFWHKASLVQHQNHYPGAGFQKSPRIAQETLVSILLSYSDEPHIFLRVPLTYNSMQTLLNIMFHDDWEINGDGTGDPQKLMFDPANRILDICDRYGAKYTFFAEFGQQLAMLKSPIKKHRIWANKWEEILKDAILRGHDVQLHFHPQWIGARYCKKKWVLDYNQWALSKLSEDEAYRNLKGGMDYLEGLLNHKGFNHRIVAFRAGGWMNQPSENIYSAFKRLGIIADVTVRRGLFRDMGNLGKIDFTNSFSNIDYWSSDKHNFALKAENDNNIISIPTYTTDIKGNKYFYLLKKNPFGLFYYTRLFLKENIKSRSKGPQIIYGSNRTLHCNFGLLHYKNTIQIINQAILDCKRLNVHNLPFIMLTHSKSFNSYRNFEKLLIHLKSLQNNNLIYFETTNDVVKCIYKKI